MAPLAMLIRAGDLGLHIPALSFPLTHLSIFGVCCPPRNGPMPLTQAPCFSPQAQLGLADAKHTREHWGCGNFRLSGMAFPQMRRLASKGRAGAWGRDLGKRSGRRNPATKAEGSWPLFSLVVSELSLCVSGPSNSGDLPDRPRLRPGLSLPSPSPSPA